MIRYRDARPRDAATLAALSRGSFAETFGHLYRAEDLAAFLGTLHAPGWRKQLADPDYRIRLAETDGRAIGYAKLGPPWLPIEPRGPAAELRQLYVLKPWQGTGVAAALMEWAVTTARARGAADLQLSVYVDNLRAKRFYARYGFARVGAYAFMVGNQADEDDLMRMAL